LIDRPFTWKCLWVFNVTQCYKIQERGSFSLLLWARTVFGTLNAKQIRKKKCILRLGFTLTKAFYLLKHKKVQTTFLCNPSGPSVSDII
jgi:hypothetical protein